MLIDSHHISYSLCTLFYSYMCAYVLFQLPVVLVIFRMSNVKCTKLHAAFMRGCLAWHKMLMDSGMILFDSVYSVVCFSKFIPRYYIIASKIRFGWLYWWECLFVRNRNNLRTHTMSTWKLHAIENYHNWIYNDNLSIIRILTGIINTAHYLVNFIETGELEQREMFEIFIEISTIGTFLEIHSSRSEFDRFRKSCQIPQKLSNPTQWKMKPNSPRKLYEFLKKQIHIEFFCFEKRPEFSGFVHFFDIRSNVQNSSKFPKIIQNRLNFSKFV